MENNNNNNENRNSDFKNDFPSWASNPAQNSNDQPPGQYNGYHYAPRRRNIGAIILVIVLILVGVTVIGNFVVMRTVNRVVSIPLSGTGTPVDQIRFSQTGVALNIGLARNDVRLETHAGSDFMVVFTPPSRGSYTRPTYEFSQNGMRLNIVEETSVNVGLFNINTSNNRGTLTVYIPRNLDGAFAGMDISTSSGSIDIRGDNGNQLANSATIRATSGRVRADGFTADTIDVRANSGSIELDSLTAASGNFNVRATSGRIRANGLTAGQGLDINTSSGNIDAENIVVNGRLSAETSSGRITIQHFIAGSATIRASSGNVTVNNGQVDNGNLTARTSSGTVRLNNLEVSGNTYTNTSSGRLTADNLTVTGNLTMESSSGGMTLGNPRVDGQTSGRATSGNVTISGMDDESRLSISTTSGNITVNGQRWRR